MQSDANDEGSEVHLNRVACLGFAPEHNPFGTYLYTPRVDALAATLRAEIIEREKAPTHKPWGMYEFAVNAPDDMLLRIGWPSVLIKGSAG